MGNMNNEKISRKLITINKGLDRAMYQTSQSKDGIIENDTNLYEDKLIEALLNTEKQYIELKKLAALTISNKVMLKNIEKYEKEVANIDIKLLKKGIICLSIPIITPFSIYHTLQLYPKNIERPYIVNAIDKTFSQLYLIQKELENFFDDNNIEQEKYKHMSVVFINHYGEKYDNIRIPDSNNYAYKALTDVICSVFKCEEIGSVVDTIIQSRSGRETFTEIYILPCQYDLKKTTLEFQKSNRTQNK